MQLVGQSVKHSIFGKGVVTGFSGEIVTVHFPKGEKKFVYPEAFSSFLTLKDADTQKQINASWQKKVEAQRLEHKKEEARMQRRRELRQIKLSPNSQAVFQVQDAKAILEAGEIATGCYLSGASRGLPRIPSRMNANSACLLTSLPKGGRESERRIEAVLMPTEDFEGEKCTTGKIPAHEQYRLCLPEGKELFYWSYFDTEKEPPRWGKVDFKYFANTVMQQILRDMEDCFEQEEQKQKVKEFYHYFCFVNRLEE